MIDKEATIRKLADQLDEIRRRDEDYATRYVLVFAAVDSALALGYEAGVRLDPAEPEWPVVYIELPTGQVSWHMPQHPVEYDGHTTEQKLGRLAEYKEYADETLDQPQKVETLPPGDHWGEAL